MKLQNIVIVSITISLSYSLQHHRKKTPKTKEISLAIAGDDLIPDIIKISGISLDLKENIPRYERIVESDLLSGNANKDVVNDPDKLKGTVDGVPGFDSDKLKQRLYSLLGKIKTHPQASIYALVTGEVPKEHLDRFGNGNQDKKGEINGYRSGESSVEAVRENSSMSITQDEAKRFQSSSGIEAENRFPVLSDTESNANHFSKQQRLIRAEGVTRRSSRPKRDNKGIMYLPINQPHADPCAPPKGSKLLEALPLVFLSTILSVADAVGNVINNINNNNNNNNNNNDNNINNDNTNLGANINNANQINVVPLGGRALRMARALMNAIGRMALGVYDAIMPSAAAGGGEQEKDGENKDIVEDKSAIQNISTVNQKNKSPENHSREEREISEVSNIHQISLNRAIIRNVTQVRKQNGGMYYVNERNKRTSRDTSTATLLLSEDEIKHIMKLHSLDKQNCLADVILLEEKLPEAEHIYRNYLKILKDQIKFIL